MGLLSYTCKSGFSFHPHHLTNQLINERTSELNGEWNRQEELSRAGLPIKRTKAFNPEAKNIADRHVLRPVPQSFIDGLMQNNGESFDRRAKSGASESGILRNENLSSEQE
jgi:hypothetical protein